jgi:hypothetical protein
MNGFSAVNIYIIHITLMEEKNIIDCLLIYLFQFGPVDQASSGYRRLEKFMRL